MATGGYSSNERSVNDVIPKTSISQKNEVNSIGRGPTAKLEPGMKFSWDLPLRDNLTTILSTEGGFLSDLFSLSWHSNHEDLELRRSPLLDMSGVLRSMLAHVNQDLRASLRARATGIKSLQILEDTNVLLVFLKSPINDQDKVILKVRLLPTPDWPFSPPYMEAAIQLALQTLSPFCPHFAIMSFSLRGGGVVVPGWPLNKVVPPSQGSLGDLEVDVSLDTGESNDLGDNLPVFFVVEEFLDGSLDSWFKEALECVVRHPHHPNYQGALTHAACCLFQLVYAIFSAQRWFLFQHNDLHHKNVRLKYERGPTGEELYETWEYTIPLQRRNEKVKDKSDSLLYRLPGQIVRGRRVKIFDFGLSSLSGVCSVEESSLPNRVSIYQETAPPSSTFPHTKTTDSRQTSVKEAEIDDDSDRIVTPDVVVDDGVKLFPLAADNIRWFAKRIIMVNPSIRSRAMSAIDRHELQSLPLDGDSDDAARIPGLPVGRFVPGYDMAVWVRHMLCHSMGFCGLVAAMQKVAAGGEDNAQSVWASEFFSWICQAGAFDQTSMLFIDGQWSSKDGSYVAGPRLYVSPTTPLVQFLRPGEDVQTSSPMCSPDAMQSLLSHKFFRRWLDPPSKQTCLYRDPDSSVRYTAKMKPITVTEQERQEIRNRLQHSRSLTSNTS